MSDFVNYNHRGAGLPPGLKDMMDVLRSKNPNSKPSDTACSPFEKKTYPTQGLSHVEEYVRQLLTFQMRSLTIFPGPMLFHGKKPEIVFCFMESDTTGEATVREVFSTAGISATMDDLDEKTQTRVLKYPLPQMLVQAMAIITDVLTGAYGITPEKGLTFMYSLRRPANSDHDISQETR